MIPVLPILLLLTSAASGKNAERPHRAAIIIGVNESFEGGQAALRYADDDAARFFELFESEVDEIELLTILDDESQKLFPSAAAIARPPDRVELLAALERTSKSAAAARANGRRTELYFIYTGHGRVHGGEGEVKLTSGALTRTELTSLVLRSRAHDRTHVIIDACNAYHLVNARGPDAAAVTNNFDDAFERFVQDQSINQFPTVGVVLSTSGAGATHEWSRYQGGVFSHEIRSALAGGADADQNGHVDYAEVEAFASAANLSVPELKGKPKVFVRAPLIERNVALTDLDPGEPVVELPEQLTGHYYLEDDRGLRYAELNKTEGYAVRLRLVRRAQYALLNGEGAEVSLEGDVASRLVVTLPLALRPSDRRARGVDEPVGVFAEPFGPRFVDGFRARIDASARARPPALDTKNEAELAVDSGVRAQTVLGFVAGGVALTALGGAIWQGREASARYEEYEAAHRLDVVGASMDDANTARGRAIGLGVSAGVTAIFATLLFLAGSGD